MSMHTMLPAENACHNSDMAAGVKNNSEENENGVKLTIDLTCYFAEGIDSPRKLLTKSGRQSNQ